MLKQYNLQLTVTGTEGLKARTLGGYTYAGQLTVEADTQVFLKNNGILLVSGTINKKNDELIDPITFSEQISISTNKMTYKKEYKEETVELEAGVDNLFNNSTISHIKVKIARQGIIAQFMFKSLTLEGNAIKV